MGLRGPRLAGGLGTVVAAVFAAGVAIALVTVFVISMVGIWCHVGIRSNSVISTQMQMLRKRTVQLNIKYFRDFCSEKV